MTSPSIDILPPITMEEGGSLSFDNRYPRLQKKEESRPQIRRSLRRAFVGKGSR